MKIGGELFTFRKVQPSETKLMEALFRLRLEVYAYECGFIDAKDYPDGIEKDDHDAQSIHFAAIGESGDVIGTMRMILPGALPLPIEQHCPGLKLDDLSKPEMKCTEISRLVISKRIRRRQNDGLYYEPEVEDKVGTDEKGREYRRRCRPMAFGLYREMYLESKRLGITHWCSLMEKSLWILLRVHGFTFTPIGEEIDLFGPVRPYISRIAGVEEEVAEKFPQFHQWFIAKDPNAESLNQSYPF